MGATRPPLGIYRGVSNLWSSLACICRSHIIFEVPRKHIADAMAPTCSACMSMGLRPSRGNKATADLLLKWGVTRHRAAGERSQHMHANISPTVDIASWGLILATLHVGDPQCIPLSKPNQEDQLLSPPETGLRESTTEAGINSIILVVIVCLGA